MKTKTKIMILMGVLSASTQAADKTPELISKFIEVANSASVARDYSEFKTLFCSEATENHVKYTYFEDKDMTFTRATLNPSQPGYFGGIKHDYILHLCSESVTTKEKCIIEPVIEKEGELCIISHARKR